VLSVQRLIVRLGGLSVLRSLSLEVPAGGIVGLVGRNGAGKTTTLRSIMGLVPVVSGNVILDGQELVGHRKAGHDHEPHGRLAVWEVLRELHQQGRTIVMSTHNMEEADRLGDRLAIVDHGKLLAVDAPDKLKARAPGGTLIQLSLDGEASAVVPLAGALPGVSRAEANNATLLAYSDRGGELIPALIRAAEQSGRTVKDIHLSPPSLETLFISMTGRKLD